VVSHSLRFGGDLSLGEGEKHETHAIRAGRPKETPRGSFSASWRRTTLKKHSPTRAISPSLDRVRSKPTSREERSLEIFKNFCSFEKFPEARCVCACALFDRPTTTTNETKKRLEEKEYNYYSPCSTSSSPSSRPGRIGSGRTRCFSTSAPRETRARSPSLATRTRWRCTQS